MVRDARSQLGRWTSHAPDLVHMELLLGAELARIDRDVVHADRVYQQGGRAAQEQSFIHHAALAHERRGRMFLDLRRETAATAAFAQARSHYQQWGVEAKVRQLGEQLDRFRA